MSSQPNKVCIVQYNASAFLTRVDRSARALVESGFEVVLIAIKDDDTAEYEERAGYVVKRVRLRTRRLTPRFGLRALRWVEAVWRTLVAAWREDADIYNPRDIYPLLVCWLAAKLRGACYVYDSDELNLDRNWPWTDRRWWRVLAGAYERFFIRRAAAVVTTDQGRAEILAQRNAIEMPTVVMNVPEIVDPLEPDRDFRERALAGKETLLVYAGALLANRGLLETVEAMRDLPECALAFVGFGNLAEAISAHIEDLGLEDRVHVFQAVPYETMMSRLAACDIGLIPIFGVRLSYVHAAPNKLFEYMMAGLPVVASDLPGMAPIVREERVGTLISDPSDPSDIARSVRVLLDGSESLHSFGERGREAVQRRYNWALEKRKMLGVYRNLGC